LLLLFLVVGAFHLARANLDVNSAAAAASRAASLTRTAPAALTAARDSATADLAGQCAAVDVSVDTSHFQRGGAVRVHVACTVTTHGLTGIGLPGTMTVQADSTSPLDLYRATS
jgi:Flp pilus assembly protein TadG